jgi:hypothetical protein
VTASLQPTAAAYADALYALERALDASRTQWDDSARQAFDRRYGDQIISAGKRARTELHDLARELDAAARMLDAPG